MSAILAIDQGTSGTTCMVVGADGGILGRAGSEFTQHYPRPGWVEHDPEEIWTTTVRVARAALAAAREAGPVDLRGIGITNQRETTVVWDRATGAPVHNAIVWQDRRTAARCRELQAGGAEALVRSRTGLLIDPYFSATKFEWILENVPHTAERARDGELAGGTIDSWLIWKLTGGRVHATEPTNASRTMLYDIDDGDWHPELLETFGVPRAMLPDVLPSSGVFGETEPDLFGRSVPVAGAAGDQQAALFGQGCWSPGLAKNTYGTGAFLLLHTGDRRVESEAGLLTTMACDVAGQPAYALEGAIFIAGAAVQWLRDGLGLIREAGETAALAAGLESNDGVYFVPAFVGLGAPHWNPEARGTLVGLTRGTDTRHLARAVLEAMAFATRDVLIAMEKDAGVPATELAVDGGAAANDWMMQFQADLVDLPVRRPANLETTALGAAGLAGLATGVWPDGEAFIEARPEPTLFRPAMEGDARRRLVRGWERAVDTALFWARAHED